MEHHWDITLKTSRSSKIHPLSSVSGFGASGRRKGFGFREAFSQLSQDVTSLILSHTQEGMRKTPAQTVRNAGVAKYRLQVGAFKP